jgi:hypothetical protein
MKREEEMLREACAQLAQEETEQWEQGLTRTELNRAEEAYRRHRRRALSLIRRNTQKQAPVGKWLQIAAILVILTGTVYWTLEQSPRETVVPQVQLSGVTVVPYYSPVPSPSPSAEAVWVDFPTAVPISPTNTPFSPTNTQISEKISTISPTSTPTPAPTPEPTPTLTPGPTTVPTPVPTAEPSPAPVPALPEDWTGDHFPMGLLDAAGKPAVTRGDGWQQAAWDAWTFTEYADDRVLDVPEDAEVSYVQWENTVALRMETEAGVTLAWVQDGHSLRLFTASGDAVEMAKSVKKIFEE